MGGPRHKAEVKKGFHHLTPNPFNSQVPGVIQGHTMKTLPRTTHGISGCCVKLESNMSLHKLIWIEFGSQPPQDLVEMESELIQFFGKCQPHMRPHCGTWDHTVARETWTPPPPWDPPLPPRPELTDTQLKTLWPKPGRRCRWGVCALWPLDCVRNKHGVGGGPATGLQQ